MREQREPWLTLPAKDAGSKGSPHLDPRFRTHVVLVQPAAAASPESAARPVSRSRPEPGEPEIVLLGRAPSAAPTPAAIERAAAAASIARPVAIRPEPPSARLGLVAETPRLPLKAVEARAPAAPSMGLDDVPLVSSVDWAVKVGEAAKMVDVVVVFYASAYLGSDMFEFAFRTVVNELLPRLGRPYTVYRFSLDAEPGFVPEMVTALGLAMDNAVTVAGFAWSGPGRRPFILGDRAFESPAVFQRFLRRSLTSEPAQLSRAGEVRRQSIAAIERPRSGAVRPWGGRMLAVLAWCLFGTAALGAAVLAFAPRWTNSLLHSTSVPGQSAGIPGPGAAADNPSALGNAQTGAAAPLVSPDEAASAPEAEPAPAQVKPAKPVKHAKRKHTPWLTLNPTYWGIPSDGRSR